MHEIGVLEFKDFWMCKLGILGLGIRIGVLVKLCALVDEIKRENLRDWQRYWLGLILGQNQRVLNGNRWQKKLGFDGFWWIRLFRFLGV